MFRADTLAGAAAMLSALLGGGGGDARILGLAHMLDAKVGLALAVAAIGSTRLPARLANRLLARLDRPIAVASLESLWFAGLLVACATVIAAGSYDPFLYFRF